MADLDPAGLTPLLQPLWDHQGSDLLLTAGAPPLVRIDGVLRPLAGEERLTAADTHRLVEGLLGQALFDRFRRDLQLDFSFTWADKARFRGNAFHQKGTVALALRMIPFAIPTTEQLRLPPIVSRWAMLSQGFVIVTGATGSGKSSTLAAMIDSINQHRAVHVVTIEDPVEYLFEHRCAAVNQREVGVDTPSFAAGLKAALREDPDVVMVGEMRDLESISAALTIAETGHLVFATLHSNDTAQALDRIVDVFPAEQQPQIRLQLASTLVGILNQQLVPRIGGGRVAAVEVLTATTAVRNLIREGKTRQIRNVITTGQGDEMQTMETALSSLVVQGVVAYEEAVARTSYPRDIALAPASTETGADDAGRGRTGRRASRSRAAR